MNCCLFFFPPQDRWRSQLCGSRKVLPLLQYPGEWQGSKVSEVLNVCLSLLTFSPSWLCPGLSRGIQRLPRGAVLQLWRRQLPGQTLQVVAVLWRSEVAVGFSWSSVTTEGQSSVADLTQSSLSAAENPCELNCMPKGENFFYRHRQAVVDGTPCHPGRKDVCVGGVCKVWHNSSKDHRHSLATFPHSQSSSSPVVHNYSSMSYNR